MQDTRQRPFLHFRENDNSANNCQTTGALKKTEVKKCYRLLRNSFDAISLAIANQKLNLWDVKMEHFIYKNKYVNQI